MKKISIAIEGNDGSGKGTLASILSTVCRKNGVECLVIGRLEQDSTAEVERLTSILQNGSRLRSPQTDFAIRIARDYLRVEKGAAAKSGLVIYDRFVLTNIALLDACSLDMSLYSFALLQLLDYSNIETTIFCDCPFEASWKRVVGRKILSSKEKRGKEYNYRLAQCMEKFTHKPEYTRRLIRIDTNNGVESIVKFAETFIQTSFP